MNGVCAKGGTSAITRGVGRTETLGNSPVWEEENCPSSATHPLRARILEHVYKRAMRDLLIAPVRLYIALTLRGQEVTNTAPPVSFVPYSPLKGTGACKEGPEDTRIKRA